MSFQMKKLSLLIMVVVMCSAVLAREHHVAKNGSDKNKGTTTKPFLTISAAADVAMPGDVITVHAGTYRERINPPRGGKSNRKRIVYRAAKGEKVVIKGSEVVKGWKNVEGETWKVDIANSFFGDFNPYSDLIVGDWFNGKGRKHHTGAVYLNDHWHIEAANLEDVLKPIGEATGRYVAGSSDQYMLNVAWLRAGDGDKIAADSFTGQSDGVQAADCSEGGKCIGWIENGDWVKYDGVDFGKDCGQVEIRGASPSQGGIVELRLDKPDGELIGTCRVKGTGDWQVWKSFKAKIKPVSGVKNLCLVFRASTSEDVPNNLLWYGKVDEKTTTIWAQFKGVNPNESQVEINVRKTVFYPDKEGINYITVAGFTMMHGATPWSPPTAEQIGLIGTHWSKGWIIEDNDIRYSVCTGLTLGKHGDEFDNTSANSAEGYVKTIERGLAKGWSKENIGHHVVRNNRISHCEQAGIVGSLGPVFCTVTGNVIHDIHIRRLFTGAEMAGIKFHGAVDTEISDNHIYRTCRGIWLDWMTQGTRVTRNLLHDNGPSEDLFVEVNHGPFLVDNNIMLSKIGILVNSQGGAYVHNLIAGDVRVIYGERRLTPHLKSHSTEVAGLGSNLSGDERFYNNIFVNGGLFNYDRAKLPVFMEGNVFLNGAKPSKHEQNPLVLADCNPEINLIEKSDGYYFQITFDEAWSKQKCELVTTKLLGSAKTPDLRYEKPDGSAYSVAWDYFGNKRNKSNPSVGPIENRKTGEITFKVR